VFQTAGAFDRMLTAFGATLVTLHAQLIFPLPRNRQVRELVFNTFSHYFVWPSADYFTLPHPSVL
jgi:hypothetical protein